MAGEHDRVGAHRVGDPDQRARIAGFGDLGRDGDQTWASRRARRPVLVDGTRHTATSPTGVTVSDNAFAARSVTTCTGASPSSRPEPGQRGFGDEDLDDEPTPQRRLDEVGPLGEEACGTAPSDVALQLDRCRHPVGALGERCQAASPDGAFTSSGSAALATSTSAVNAAGSLMAISARFLRSTSTPAALRPWISRL